MYIVKYLLTEMTTKLFVLHRKRIFTLQYVNKSIVNVKVIQNNNIVVILALKTSDFLSKNRQETGANLLRNFILRRSGVDRIDH